MARFREKVFQQSEKALRLIIDHRPSTEETTTKIRQQFKISDDYRIESTTVCQRDNSVDRWTEAREGQFMRTAMVDRNNTWVRHSNGKFIALLCNKGYLTLLVDGCVDPSSVSIREST